MDLAAVLPARKVTVTTACVGESTVTATSVGRSCLMSPVRPQHIHVIANRIRVARRGSAMMAERTCAEVALWGVRGSSERALAATPLRAAVHSLDLAR